MEKILENLWVLFIGIGSWMINRMTSKIDALEKDKADGTTTREEHLSQSKLIHELDRRVDENQHTSISRPEFKADITSLHVRVNDLERRKADKIKNIRTHASKEKNGES
jgi:myosin-crossreactive antigen